MRVLPGEPTKSRLLSLEDVVDRLVQEAERLQLDIVLKTTLLELESLHRIVTVVLAPREWDQSHRAVRTARLEIGYGAYETHASSPDFEGRLPRGAANLHVDIVLRLVGIGGLSPEEQERQARALFDALTPVFHGGLALAYEVWVGRGKPPAAGGAQAQTNVRLSLREGSFDLGFLAQVAAGLRLIGPGGRSY